MTRINGVELHVETLGAGGPLLLLHGNGLDHSYLRPAHDALAQDQRVIYFDQRWHGRSERRGPADDDTKRTDTLALLDALGETRATIFGHSYGSWLAIEFAVRHPDRVGALILCGTAPAFDYAGDIVAAATARNPEAAAALLAALQNGVQSAEELRATWKRVLPLYFHGDVPAGFFAETRFSVEGFMAGNQRLPALSYLDVLPGLDVPILVLAGAHDFITPPAQAHRLAALTPRATVVELANSGHFPFVEEPAAYVAAIRRWQATNLR